MKVEIWADLVCPWCYIGKRRLASALRGFAHGQETEVIWRSYQLDPDAPAIPTQSVNEMLANKYGVSLAEAAAKNAQVSELAARDGLEYHIDRARYTNSFSAHRLNHLAAAYKLQDEMGDRLFRFYFTEGGSLADTDALAGLASEVGLPAEKAREVLQSSARADEVGADIRQANRLDIRGVPFFLVDGKYGLSGAQSASGTPARRPNCREPVTIKRPGAESLSTAVLR
jgi:predicted DsbA family dithiol-disulfide isomerase